jgi:hypothetical protein
MYDQKRQIDNAHITRERDRRRFRELLAVLSLGAPVGLFLLLFTWQNLEVIRLGRQSSQLRSEVKKLEETNKRLRVDIEHLTSLAGVETKASALGLSRTEADRIVTLLVSDAATRTPPPVTRESTALPPQVARPLRTAPSEVAR